MSKIRASSPLATPAPPDTGCQRVTFLIVPRFNMATLITMIEPLRVANYLSSQPIYDWDILSFDGSDIPASNGLSIAASLPIPRNRRGEIVCVLASWGAETYANREVTGWLRRQAREGARICPVENGGYLVARAGLLSGKATAVHWAWAPGFQEQFPDVPVSGDLFTLGERALSSAGGTSGIDLMLRLIAEAHGAVMAGEVAGQMLYHPVRTATTPQRPTAGQAGDSLDPLVRRAVDLIGQAIADPLSVPAISAALGTSQRQLERQFRQAIGCTVVQFSALCRLQHARVLLISTKLSVRDIATASGFNSLSHFAQSFGKCFGRRPSDYRQGWAKDDPAPSWPGTLAAFLGSLQQPGQGTGGRRAGA